MALRMCAVVAAGFVATALPVTGGILQMDINSVSAQARGQGGGAGPFGGVGHTGSVHLSSNANTALAEIILNGASQNIAPNQLQSFSGIINLVAGNVVGGNFSMTVVGGATFNTQIQGGFGQVNTQAGQGFRIDGLLTSALFSSDPFAGVAITPWFNAQPLDGSFINFSFNPNANGFDGDTSLDIFLIPSPAAGGVLGLAMAGFAGRRRRA